MCACVLFLDVWMNLCVHVCNIECVYAYVSIPVYVYMSRHLYIYTWWYMYIYIYLIVYAGVIYVYICKRHKWIYVCILILVKLYTCKYKDSWWIVVHEFLLECRVPIWMESQVIFRHSNKDVWLLNHAKTHISYIRGPCDPVCRMRLKAI